MEWVLGTISSEVTLLLLGADTSVTGVGKRTHVRVGYRREGEGNEEVARDEGYDSICYVFLEYFPHWMELRDKGLSLRLVVA
jgi:hypothetical protein